MVPTMKKILFASAALAALLSIPARADFLMPGDRAKITNNEQGSTNWIVYGQTSITTGSNVSNRTSNSAGTFGEVAALPYTVPAGNCLYITAHGIEGYLSTAGVANMFMWLGPTLSSNAVVLFSVNANDRLDELLGFQPEIPGGTIVNLNMANTQGTTQIYGWYIKGRLVHGPCR